MADRRRLTISAYQIRAALTHLHKSLARKDEQASRFGRGLRTPVTESESILKLLFVTWPMTV